MRAMTAATHVPSSCGSWTLEHSLSGCGTWAQLLCSLWDFPKPGIKPMSSVLAGRFYTAEPPENPPPVQFFFVWFSWNISFFFFSQLFLLVGG